MPLRPKSDLHDRIGPCEWLGDDWQCRILDRSRYKTNINRLDAFGMKIIWRGIRSSPKLFRSCRVTVPLASGSVAVLLV